MGHCQLHTPGILAELVMTMKNQELEWLTAAEKKHVQTESRRSFALFKSP